jgi:hypothetical protein
MARSGEPHLAALPLVCSWLYGNDLALNRIGLLSKRAPQLFVGPIVRYPKCWHVDIVMASRQKPSWVTKSFRT